MTIYAITETGYRAILEGEVLAPGETATNELPASLLLAIQKELARSRRNDLLRASDWTQVPDTSLPVANKLLWTTYRQLLRDLPQLPNFPDVAWPEEPPLPPGAGVSR